MEGIGEVAFLIPQEGLLVRDPKTKEQLNPAGEEKPMTGPEGRYWRRRIRDKSVLIKKPLTIPKAELQRKVGTKKEGK